jgi:hypothetical protein
MAKLAKTVTVKLTTLTTFVPILSQIVTYGCHKKGIMGKKCPFADATLAPTATFST